MDLTNDWFVKTVNHFLDTKRQAPIPSEFEFEAKRERARIELEVNKAREMVQEKNGNRCPYCDPNLPGMSWSDTIPREVGRCVCLDGNKYQDWMPEARWLQGLKLRQGWNNGRAERYP